MRDERTGLDVMLCFDISRSMLAQDVAPSRLERSVAIAKGLIDRVPGARFGVVVFKGQATQVIPLTEDSAAIQGLFDALGPGMVTTPGTDIESGLAVAVDAFAGALDTRRTVVLFTDGGMLSGNPLRAAEAAQEMGVEIHVIATGGREAAPIPLPDGSTLLDGDGREVRTQLREDVTRGIAEASGGEVFSAADSGTLSGLIGALHGRAADLRQGFVFRSEDRYRSFLLVSFTCLMIGVIVRAVRWRRVF